MIVSAHGFGVSHARPWMIKYTILLITLRSLHVSR
jgi:hypothetical protein